MVLYALLNARPCVSLEGGGRSTERCFSLIANDNDLHGVVLLDAVSYVCTSVWIKLGDISDHLSRAYRCNILNVSKIVRLMFLRSYVPLSRAVIRLLYLYKIAQLYYTQIYIITLYYIQIYINLYNYIILHTNLYNYIILYINLYNYYNYCLW